MFVGQLAVLSGFLLTSSPVHRVSRSSTRASCRTLAYDPDTLVCQMTPTLIDVVVRDTDESRPTPCVMGDIVPASKLGVSYGLEVQRVGAGSLEELVGLRPGDIALSINGLSLATPEAALHAYSRLKRRSILWLVVRRKKRLVVLTYRILRTPHTQTNPVRSSPTSLTHPGR